MRYGKLQRFRPRSLRNYVLDIEASIERALSSSAADLPRERESSMPAPAKAATAASSGCWRGGY